MNVLFRCDASKNIGSGHVMRCLTLANEMKSRNWDCAFITTKDSGPFLNDRDFQLFFIQGKSFEDEINNILSTAKTYQADWIIFDHYDRDEEVESIVRSAGFRIAVIDDLADRKHDCDVLIDQTYRRSKDDYSGLIPYETKQLIGADYTLIAPQFSQLRTQALEKRSKTATVENILVSLGSTNYKNCTGFVLQALREYKSSKLNIDVVLGAAAENVPLIKKLIKDTNENSIHNAKFHQNISNMNELMLKADVAIGAGGTTSWERCCLGLPTIMIEIADNQTFLTKKLEDNKAIINLGRLENLTSQILNSELKKLIFSNDTLKALSKNAFSVCDGRGRDRILPELLREMKTKNDKEVRLRFLRMEDADQLLCWQSAPGLREYSRNPEVPTREEHEEWMACSINKTNRYPYIITVDEKPAGIIRLDKLDNENLFEISILVDPGFQGIGLAKAAHNLMIQMHGNIKILAEIHPENRPSLKLFKSLGYKKQGEREYILNQDTYA